MQRPVVAYFQFIQNNAQHIQAGDVDRALREAEQKHREIMQASARSQYDALRQQSAEIEMQNHTLQAQIHQSQNNALNTHFQTGSDNMTGLQNRLQEMQTEH